MITVLKAWWQMSFSTDSDLSYKYLQYKSEKVHGIFGLGWKNLEHTVTSENSCHSIQSKNEYLPKIMKTKDFWAFYRLQISRTTLNLILKKIIQKLFQVYISLAQSSMHFFCRSPYQSLVKIYLIQIGFNCLTLKFQFYASKFLFIIYFYGYLLFILSNERTLPLFVFWE